MSAAQALEQLLHEEIPLTRALGLTVTQAAPARVCLAAPLAPNINHKATAFGGSLYALAVLAGWGMIAVRLKAAGLQAHIVIQEAQIRYRQPVTDTLQAECHVPDEAAFARFLRIFARHGKARISLPVTMRGTAGEAVVFHGDYVIHS
ncbi:YiiD C-terminal domain-containing protein [Chitinilyticum litopenaei]|uniref:YiiD C-terminal domain-containing protein n=1 Tax=Chitinilyticum litopenaei TaxID=1121276 RepID=UPI001B7FD478|nr:YiiD C-terminal domain-containing protein [Chitinilyticum litopenaei]